MSTLGHRWTTLDLAEAKRLYDSGLSFEQVGRQIGTSKSYLAYRFRRDGIPARPSGRPLTTPAPNVDLEDLVQRREVGESYRSIAAALGISADMARDRYLRATNRPRRAVQTTRR